MVHVDVFEDAIQAGLAQRNLTSIVNMLFVSNPGMAHTHDNKWMQVNDVVEEGHAGEIEWQVDVYAR